MINLAIVPDTINPDLLTVNGKQVDLSRILPLTVGDWRRIKGAVGIDLLKLRGAEVQIELDQIVNLAVLVLKKGNPAIVLEDVDTLTPAQLAQLNKRIFTDGGQVDRPT